MTTARLNTEDVLKSIVGKRTPQGRVENTAPQPPEEERLKRTVYVTRKQFKAMKLRAATSDKPEETDISAIVRAALDKYFNETDETKAGE